MTNEIALTAGELPVRVAARAIDVLLVGTVDALLGKQIGFGSDWLLISAAIVILYFALWMSTRERRWGSSLLVCAYLARTEASLPLARRSRVRLSRCLAQYRSSGHCSLLLLGPGSSRRSAQAPSVRVNTTSLLAELVSSVSRARA